MCDVLYMFLLKYLLGKSVLNKSLTAVALLTA